MKKTFFKSAVGEELTFSLFGTRVRHGTARHACATTARIGYNTSYVWKIKYVQCTHSWFFELFRGDMYVLIFYKPIIRHFNENAFILCSQLLALHIPIWSGDRERERDAFFFCWVHHGI